MAATFKSFLMENFVKSEEVNTFNKFKYSQRNMKVWLNLFLIISFCTNGMVLFLKETLSLYPGFSRVPLIIMLVADTILYFLFKKVNKFE